MKKILFMTGHSRNHYKWRMVGEAAGRLLEDKENDIYYLDCAGKLKGYCGLNTRNYFWYCKKCYPECLKAMAAVGFDLSKTVKLKKVKVPKFPNFKSIQEALDYECEGYKIGLGPVSCVMTLTRDYAFDIKKWNGKIHSFFETVYTVIKNIEELDAIHNFDEIHTFNGRMPFCFAAVAYAQKHNKPYIVYTSGGSRNRLRTLHNTVPHSLDNTKEEVRTLWAKAGDDRDEIAQKWFNDRRAGKFQTLASFTKDQIKNYMPKGYDDSKENIVFFNSSIDEVYAFESWKHPFAENENVVIRQMLEHYKDDKTKHFYLRIHPNLTRAKKKKATQIREINQMKKEFKDMLTVIEPDEKIDTYALIDAADKVVTTYSTTGCEATYWGTVAILAGISPYDELDCVYKAKSMEELYALIDDKTLKPKPKESTYPCGYCFAMRGELHRYTPLKEGETGE